MTTEIIYKMLKDIQAHKRDKQKLLETYIQQRLDLSLTNYYADLMQTYNFLSRRDARNALKKLAGGNK